MAWAWREIETAHAPTAKLQHVGLSWRTPAGWRTKACNAARCIPRLKKKKQERKKATLTRSADEPTRGTGTPPAAVFFRLAIIIYFLLSTGNHISEGSCPASWNFWDEIMESRSTACSNLGRPPLCELAARHDRGHGDAQRMDFQVGKMAGVDVISGACISTAQFEFQVRLQRAGERASLAGRLQALPALFVGGHSWWLLSRFPLSNFSSSDLLQTFKDVGATPTSVLWWMRLNLQQAPRVAAVLFCST